MKITVTCVYEIQDKLAMALVPEGTGGVYGPRETKMSSGAINGSWWPDPVSVRVRREETPDECRERRQAERFDNGD